MNAAFTCRPIQRPAGRHQIPLCIRPIAAGEAVQDGICPATAVRRRQGQGQHASPYRQTFFKLHQRPLSSGCWCNRNCGTVLGFSTDDTDYTVLKHFGGPDGPSPWVTG